jgi:hypothetical protein
MIDKRFVYLIGLEYSKLIIFMAVTKFWNLSLMKGEMTIEKICCAGLRVFFNFILLRFLFRENFKK